MTSAQDSRLIFLESFKIHSQDIVLFLIFLDFLSGWYLQTTFFVVWINRSSIKHRFSGQDYLAIRKSFGTHLSSRTNKERTVLRKKINDLLTKMKLLCFYI